MKEYRHTDYAHNIIRYQEAQARIGVKLMYTEKLGCTNTAMELLRIDFQISQTFPISKSKNHPNLAMHNCKSTTSSRRDASWFTCR